MCVLERKARRCIVIEGRCVPIRLVVAHLAVRRELCGRMRRVRRGVVILLVTGHTSGGSTRKPLCVALVASHLPMSAIQRERRRRVVVERTGLPSSLRMTSLAIRAEPCLRMYRFRRGVVILLMASHASSGSTCKALRVTLVATQTKMPALEREVRRRIVVEGRITPIHPIVTHLAILRKIGRSMRRIRRGIVILQMAGSTFGTHRIEPQPRSRLVALVAIHPGVPAFQWKPCLPMNFRDVAHHPGGCIVASVTVLTQSALMYIFVASSTIRLGIRKYEGGVASLARNILVLPGKLERSRVVVEPLLLNNPVFGRMTNGTIHFQRISMRRLRRQLRDKQQQENYLWHLEHSMSLNLYSTYVPLGVLINL